MCELVDEPPERFFQGKWFEDETTKADQYIRNLEYETGWCLECLEPDGWQVIEPPPQGKAVFVPKGTQLRVSRRSE